MVLAVVLGLAGFAVSFLDFNLPHTATFNLSITLGLFFPLIIALAWGWAYGLLSSLAGGCQSMWWIWHADGWGLLYTVPVFCLWIGWHGWWATTRNRKSSHPWYQCIFIIEIPFRVVSEAGFLTLYPLLLSLNPPPWAPTLSATMVTRETMLGACMDHIIAGYLLLLLAHVVLHLTWVRKALGLPEKTVPRDVSTLYAFALFTALIIWIADAMLHFQLGNADHASFWDVALFHPGPHLFIRMTFIVFALGGAMVVASMLRNRERLQQRITHLNHVLAGLHQVNRIIDRVKDPHDLIKAICDQLVQAEGYLSVCIFRFNARGDYLDHGLAGVPEKHFRSMQQHASPPLLCPCCRQALKLQELVTAPHLSGTCTDCPFRDNQQYMDTPMGCLAHPITYRDITYGVIAASLPLDRSQDLQEQYLFKEIATDIAFALHSLEEEAERRLAEIALRQSEQRFSRLLDSVPEVAVQGYGSDGTIHYWNKASEMIYGYTRQEAVGQNFRQVLPDPMQEQIRHLLAAEDPDTHMPAPSERTFTNNRGRTFTVLSSYALIPGTGQEHNLYCVDMDLSQLKQTESRLKDSQAQIQSIFRSAPVGIGLVQNRIFTRVNQHFCQMLGYREEELLGKPSTMIYPSQEEYDRVGREKYALMRKTGTGTVETRFQQKNGDILYVLLSSSPLDMNDLSKGVTFSALDITDRKQAIDALRQSQEHLKTTLQSIGDAVVTTDHQTRVVTMNPVAETLTGWTQDEARGLPLRKVFPIISAMDRKECENPAARAMSQGTIVGLANHTLLIAKDGRERYIADSAAPIRNLDGQITGAVLVFRDVTQEYRMRRELQKMDKLESLGKLAGGLAHDFNNILMAIYGNIELASSQFAPDHPARTFLDHAGQSIDRATKITNKLLTFSKGGSPVKEQLSLESLVRETVSFDLSGSGVKPVFTTQDHLPDILGDRGQLEQVFSNLTANARQAMDNQGTLYVTLSNTQVKEREIIGLQPGDYVCIVLEDTGPGIPAEHVGKVFDPYFTTHQTRSGLGLATVYSIISRHGGLITAESPQQQGARFTMYLPAMDTPPNRLQSPSTRTDNVSADTTSSRPPKRILIMDDEPMIQDVLSELLKALHYEVEITSNGTQAVEAYRKSMETGSPFDAVILDLTIPGGMGGARTIRELARMDPQVKGIVSSGYADDPIMARYQDYGFKGVAIKPYTLEELGNTLDRVLG
jgi:PAS domain S-box-containing protein